MKDLVKSTAGIAVCASILCIIKYLWRLSMSRRFCIENKVVLITGASSGLGEACAHAFHKAGAKLILAARRVNELERVAKEITDVGRISDENKPKILPLDLENIESIPKFAKDALSCYGRIDILVNNGGMSFRGEAITTALDVDVQIMKVNYFGQIALTKALLPAMIAQGEGHIIGIGSVQSRIAIPYRSSYTASKHAFQAFLDSLRAEIAHQNVRVSAINPAYIRTGLSVNAVTADGSKYGVQDKNTLEGMEPNYVARKVLEVARSGDNETLLAPLHHKFIVCVRSLFPDLFFKIMASRARKQRKDDEKTK